MEPSTSHPYVKDELEYLYYINSTAEKTTRNTHPRYHQVYQNKFLLERILMLQYKYLADTTTEEYYKNGHIRNALKFAFNNLDAMTSNSDSSLKDIYVIPEDEKLVMVKILDKYAISHEIRISPEKLWALMGKLKYYDRAYEYLKLSITNKYFMYFESQYPLVAEVCNATKKNDELVALIEKYRTGTEKNEVFEKVYVYQYLNRTKEAIEAIKTSKWGTINFFVDEFAGQKVLEYAVKNKQQEILDFFYTEVFNKYELNKSPRKLVFTSDYEDLKTLVSITQKCGNYELSEKLDKYYYKSIKMK